MRASLVVGIAALLASASAAADSSQVVQAAQVAAPEVDWQANSVLSANFTCQGKVVHAVLGSTRSAEVTHEGQQIGVTSPQVVVAIFSAGLSAPPERLEFPLHSTTLATLKPESRNASIAAMKRAVGEVPKGTRQSRSCKGLVLSDGEHDSAHIYWNQQQRMFLVWSL